MLIESAGVSSAVKASIASRIGKAPVTNAKFQSVRRGGGNVQNRGRIGAGGAGQRRGGQRGGGRPGQRAGGRSRVPKKTPTQAELDADLDAFNNKVSTIDICHCFRFLTLLSNCRWNKSHPSKKTYP